MMRLWHKRPYYFKESKLEECIEILNNPACGWYQIHTFYLDKEPDMEELRWCVDKDDRMAMLLFHIGAYRNGEIEQAAIKRMRMILSFFSKYEKELIVRVVYDNVGKGLESEPFIFSILLSHVEQIGEVLSYYADRIYIFQGLFLGSWGEMHSTKFLAKKNLCAIQQILKRYLGDDTYISVRCPVYYRMLFSEINIQQKAGLYDDGIFGSNTNLGTFGERSKAEAGWENPWNPKEELAFIEELSMVAPIGGEVVCGENDMYPYDLLQTVDFLKKMHVSYLNRIHDKKVIDAWKSMTWKESGLWNGCNGYEYIGAHLGYRFRIIKTSVVFSRRRHEEKKAIVTIQIKNEGFSNCYQKMNVYLISQSEEGKSIIKKKINTDMRTLEPNKVVEVSVDITFLGDDIIYLCMMRDCDERKILFANHATQDGKVLLGEICKKEHR